MRRLRIFLSSLFRKGTNRLVVRLKDIVFKIPLHHRGYLANMQEYENCKKHPEAAARTERFLFLLRQERLYELETYPLGFRKEDLPEHARGLFDFKLNNRLQIGRNKDGEYRIYDFEDVKFYE